jgi:3-oxoacyl-(acyl-carrier-protein) synthase
LAAAGAIEAVVCVAGLNKGKFPGTPVSNADPDIPVQPTSGEIPLKGGLALSTSMAFGGTCVALLFARCDSISNRSGGNRSAVADNLENGVSIASLGVVGPFGRGVDALRAAMRRGCSKTCGSNASFSIPAEIFKTGEFKKLRRRADAISLMTLAASADAIGSANLAESEIRDLSVIFVTSFGAHTATFKFLDSMLDYGHGAPSPTSFSNSVHNAPAFHITRELGIHGSSITMTAFESPFGKALRHAESLMASGGAERVLVVAGDEINQTMMRISDLWSERRGEPHIAWGEGAVAFLLEKTPRSNTNSAKSPLSLAEMIKSSAKFADPAERLFGRVLFNDAVSLACAVSGESASDGR